MVEIPETEPQQIFAHTVANWAMAKEVASISRKRRSNGHDKRICFYLKEKEAQNSHASNF
jgi:hypothetical protein